MLALLAKLHSQLKLVTSWFCGLFTSSKSTWLRSWFDLFLCSLLHHWRGGLPRRQNPWQTWALCSQCILLVMDDLPAFAVVIIDSVVVLRCVGPTKWNRPLNKRYEYLNSRQWHMKWIFIAISLVYFTQRSFYVCKLVIY